MTDKNPAVKPEPTPQASSSPSVWPLVIHDLTKLEAPEWLKQVLAEDMRARNEMGREKYGMPLQVENGRNAGVDAYQEALDLAVYARQRQEQTRHMFWVGASGQAVGLAAAIRYQLALESEAQG